MGTSATLGSQAEQDDLLAYASAVFGEIISPDAIISESRLSAGEFLGDSLISHVDIVPSEKLAELDPASYNNYPEYIQAQHRLWLNEEISGDFNDPDWRVAFGNRIKEHLFFQNLLKALGGAIHSFDEIFSKLEKVTKALKTDDQLYKIQMLSSLLALISEARINVVSKAPDGREQPIIRPFLNVRVQLWMRELRRMVAEVSQRPVLRFADDLNEAQLETHLPLVHCRECGSMGWSGLKRKVSSQIMGALKDYYHAFFSSDPKVVYLFPVGRPPGLPEPGNTPKGDAQAQTTGIVQLCTKCLHVTAKANVDGCPSCGHDALIRVHMPDVRIKRGNRQLSVNDCPYCGSHNSLSLLGSRAAIRRSTLFVLSQPEFH